MDATRHTLLQKLRAPDAGLAWEDFYSIYWRVIVRYAMKLGLAEDAGHDVLQETMVVLMRLLPDFEYDPARGKFRNFLLTIAHRKALQTMRRQRARPTVPLDDPIEDGGRSLADVLPDDSVSLPHEVMDQQWREGLWEEAVRRVLADPTLEVRTVDVFNAYVIDQRSASDVAHAYGLAANAVYQIKNRLLKRIEAQVRELAEGEVPL